MPKIACTRCQETIQVPDDLVQAHCVRCGQILTIPNDSAANTHVTAFNLSDPVPPSAIRLDSFGGNAKENQESRALGYQNWEDFRANSPAVQRIMVGLATMPLPDLRWVECQVVPENAPDSADALGKPLATINLPGENRAMSGAIGWFFMLAGAASAVQFLFALADPNGIHGVNGNLENSLGTAVAGCFAAMFGIWFNFLRRAWLPVTMWIFENGLLCKRGDMLSACPWEEVEDLQVSLEKGRPFFRIELPNEVIARIDAVHNPSVMPLMEYTVLKLSAARFLPTLRALFEGERVRFGVVALDRDGLTGPEEFFAPWSEVVRVISDPNKIYVDVRGRANWHPIRYRDVSFAQLMMALAHVMIEEEKLLHAVPRS